MTWKIGEWLIPLHLTPKPSVMTVATHASQQAFEVQMWHVWCIHFYRYSGTVTLNGITYPIRPGYAGIIPPGVHTVYRHDSAATHGSAVTHACAHFTLPNAPGEGVSIPVLQDLGDDFAPLNKSFEEAIVCFRRNPERAGIRLWDILWRLSEGPISIDENLAREHPGNHRLYTLIEERLCEPLSVADLLEETDLSHSQLLRVFKAATGTSIQGYIQRRRLERAQQMLRESNLSVQEIADAVGMPDRRVFNKMFHRTMGCAPREFRKRHETVSATRSRR